jgi:hypothetical protein
VKPSELVAAIDELAKIAHEERRVPMVLGAPVPWELLSEYERVVTRRQVAVVLHAIARRPEFAEVYEMLLPNAVLATPQKQTPAVVCPQCRKLVSETKIEELQLVSVAQELCAECRKDELPW